jgi:hypothetical protein
MEELIVPEPMIQSISAGIDQRILAAESSSTDYLDVKDLDLTGIAQDFNLYGELSLVHKDGSFVQIYSSHVMLKNAGDEVEMYCIDIDISDRKATEAMLQKKLLQEQLIFQMTNRIRRTLDQEEVFGTILAELREALAINLTPIGVDYLWDDRRTFRYTIKPRAKGFCRNYSHGWRCLDDGD